MVKNINKRGFTFVELLVVLGIFGLLFVAGMAATDDARERADDRFIIEQMGLIKLEAEQVYRENGRQYNLVCDNTVDLRAEPSASYKRCRDGVDGYAVEMRLSTGEYYCIDTNNHGTTTQEQTILGTGNCTITAASPADCTCGP